MSDSEHIKPIVIFTNFWDANALIKNQTSLESIDDELTLLNFDNNYCVYSIAISHPDLSQLSHIKDIDRLLCLTPTYEMLKEYKADNDWEKYTKNFRKRLKAKRYEFRQFLDQLKPGVIYLLCCWENTSKGAHCHRQLVYDAINKSSTVYDKAVFIYHHGNEARNNKID